MEGRGGEKIKIFTGSSSFNYCGTLVRTVLYFPCSICEQVAIKYKINKMTGMRVRVLKAIG